MTGMLTLNSCEPEQIYPRTRLFSPVLNEDLFSVDNTIIVNMGKMKEAVSYTLEVSRDTFKTKDYTVDVDTNYVIINGELVGEELLWYTFYQVRATAHADDPQYDSKVSDLGNVRTQKFPSNMGTPTSFDVLDTQARVFWTPSGAAITGIKVYAITDVRLETPLDEITLTPAQQADAEAIVYGLSAATQYNIAIYSDDVLRGWEVYTTRPALVSGDNVIDLAGYTGTLADTLADIESGSVILLEGGRKYLTGGYKFDKSFTFMAGYSFVQALPMIDCSTNFHLLGGAVVDSIVFREIAFRGAFGSHYIFNPSEATEINVGEIKFESCDIQSLRGVGRFRGPATTVQAFNIMKFTILNCVVDSIADYAVFCIDTDPPAVTVGDIVLKNSTFSKIRTFLISRTQSNSVLIEDCTISEAPETNGIMFRWRGSAGNADITNGLTIRNTIWSNGWDRNATGSYTVSFDNGGVSLDATTVTVVNTWSTSKFAFVTGRENPAFPVGNYTGTDVDLWVEPLVMMDFHFKDAGFPGRNDTGDPRWRP